MLTIENEYDLDGYHVIEYVGGGVTRMKISNPGPMEDPSPIRHFPVRYLWRTLTPPEQTAISTATAGTTLHLFWQEIQLVNASGDPIWLDHPRFTAAIDALEASGDLSVATCTKIRNGELE